ncbi:MAG: arginase [Sphingobacteriales bacterium]|nr:arginase [Sphingobacteriales bacterium]
MDTIKIIENRSEIAAGTRGASLGIDALKIAALNNNSDFFNKYEHIEIEHQNHLLGQPVAQPYAKRIEGLAKIYDRVSRTVSRELIGRRFPLVIAGDHASAGGTIAGVKKAFPFLKLGVIWIDAHADVHSPFTTPSGNMHGMPLAIALGIDNIDCARNEPDTDTQDLWEHLKHIGGANSKITPNDLIYIGVRDTEPEEDYLISKFGIKNYSIAELNRLGALAVAKQTLQQLAHCEVLYVSFDVDSMDCELVSRGTGTPVPGGISQQQATDLVLTLLESPKVCCFEMVEINPILDTKGNMMADTAFKILEQATKTIEGRPYQGFFVTKYRNTQPLYYYHYHYKRRLTANI